RLELDEALLLGGEAGVPVALAEGLDVLDELGAGVFVREDVVDGTAAGGAAAEGLHVGDETIGVAVEEVVDGLGLVGEATEDAEGLGARVVAGLAEGELGGDADDEAIVEVAEVLDAVGDEIERLEEVV